VIKLLSNNKNRELQMAQKAIREYDAKSILAKHWDNYFPDFTYAYETVMVQNGSELKKVAKNKTWLIEKS
jgi:ATP-citrate lyase beta-subunit